MRRRTPLAVRCAQSGGGGPGKQPSGDGDGNSGDHGHTKRREGPMGMTPLHLKKGVLKRVNDTLCVRPLRDIAQVRGVKQVKGSTNNLYTQLVYSVAHDSEASAVRYVVQMSQRGNTCSPIRNQQ